MTDFNEVVKKIASSPWKRSVFQQIPNMLYKHAGLGDLLGTEGKRDIAKNVLSGVGQASILGLGGYGAARLMGDSEGNEDRIKGRQSTLGKLEAEQRYRNSQLKRLDPMHASTFESLRQDPILAKADPSLIEGSYSTMKNFAPHLAADPNATRAFLQESALYGKGPSYATLKTLAEAERAVQQTRGG
jgi:hypothetical protein